MTADGVVVPQTWSALIIQVKKGNSGDAVRGVQEEFQFRSGEPGKGLTVDGIFGPQTDSTVRGYYNLTLKRCLLLINKNTTMVDELSHTSYLIDTDRRIYAVYIETNGQVQSCTLIQSARQTTACKRRDEFDAFVSQYLEK